MAGVIDLTSPASSRGSVSPIRVRARLGDSFDLLDALNEGNDKQLRPVLENVESSTGSSNRNAKDGGSSSSSSVKRNRSTSLSDALKKPKIIDPLTMNSHAANSSKALLNVHDEGDDENDEDDGVSDILIGIPMMVSRKEDKASSKEVEKAVKTAVRAERQAEKQKEKNHSKALRVADRNELYDRLDVQRENYEEESNKAEARSAKKGHAACEVTMITDKDAQGYHHTNDAIANKAGVAVWARRAMEACAPGVNLWLRRPREHGGFFTPANVREMSVDERGAYTLPFVVVQFPPAEYLRLVMADSQHVDFFDLDTRVKALREDLISKEGVPDQHRLVLAVTEIDAAKSLYLADLKKKKSDGHDKALANKEKITIALDEAMAYLMIRHGIEVIMLPKREEVSEYLKKVTCLLADQYYAKPITNLDCVSKFKLSSSSKKRGHDDGEGGSANSMEEFGDGYMPSAASSSASAALTQDWIKMLVQVHGLTQPKAESFVRSHGGVGSCPKKLRSSLSHSSRPEGSTQRNRQLQDMFGPRKELKLSTKIVQIFSSMHGSDAVDSIDENL